MNTKSTFRQASPRICSRTCSSCRNMKCLSTFPPRQHTGAVRCNGDLVLCCQCGNECLSLNPRNPLSIGASLRRQHCAVIGNTITGSHTLPVGNVNTPRQRASTSEDSATSTHYYQGIRRTNMLRVPCWFSCRVVICDM